MSGDELDSIMPMWAEDQRARAYAAWHPTAVTFFRPTIDAVIAEAEIRPGIRVLDIGTGTGIPALAVAERVGHDGHVVASDPSSTMLAAARENARLDGRDNMSFARVVAEVLPFPGGSFDAVVSHAGIMFAADLPRALAEIGRVTRPGGRAAFLGWGTMAENPWLSIFWSAVSRYREQLKPAEELTRPQDVPVAEPDPRSPFRFAAPGSLSAALRQVFDDVREDHRLVTLPAPGRGEALLEFFLGASDFERELPAEVRGRFRDEVLSAYETFTDGATVRLPAAIVIGSGRARAEA